MKLTAPFPYFGGKSKVADIVWQALGQPAHYMEPFFGSGAVLLNRHGYDPQRHTETIVDADGFDTLLHIVMPMEIRDEEKDESDDDGEAEEIDGEEES